VVDIVEALTDSVKPQAYWRKLKERLNNEGNETVTNCHGLKMVAIFDKIFLKKIIIPITTPPRRCMQRLYPLLICNFFCIECDKLSSKKSRFI
jgi:hypothetical protein